MRRRGRGSAAGAAARRFFLSNKRSFFSFKLHHGASFHCLRSFPSFRHSARSNYQEHASSRRKQLGGRSFFSVHPSNFPRVTPHYMYHRPQHGRRARFLRACASMRDGRDPGSRVSETHKSLSHLPYRSMISIVSQHLELTVNRHVVLHWLAISYYLLGSRTARRQHRMSGAVLFRHVVPSCSTRHLKKKDHSMLNVA